MRAFLLHADDAGIFSLYYTVDSVTLLERALIYNKVILLVSALYIFFKPDITK